MTGKTAIIAAFILLAVTGLFLDSSAQVRPESQVPEPYISISPDYYYPFEEILYIEGRANAGAIVTTILQKQGEKPVKFTVKTDSSGEWVVAEKVYLTSGNWEVRARQQAGATVSGWSNPRVIRSIITGVDIFGFQIRYAVIAAIVFVFLGIVTGIFIYFRRKIAKLKRQVIEKRLIETEERVHRGFAEIRRDLMDDLKELSLRAKDRPLTPEEIERRNHLLEELDKLEKGVERDIEDVEKEY